MRDRCRNINGFGGLIVTNEAAAPIWCELVEARVWSVVLLGQPSPNPAIRYRLRQLRVYLGM